MTSQQNNNNHLSMNSIDEQTSNMKYISDFIDVDNYQKLRQRQTQKIFNLIGPSSTINVDDRQQRKVHLQFASEHLSNDAHSVLLQKRDSIQSHEPYNISNAEIHS